MSSSPIPPPFRKELTLYVGPRESCGWPTYSIFDPVSSKYYKINWEECYIFKIAQEGMSCEEIAQALKEQSTIDVTGEEVAGFFHQVDKLGLLQSHRSAELVKQRYLKERQSKLTWFLHHYLFFRVPLVSPDQFLERTLPLVRPLWSRQALFLYLFLSLTGIVLLLPRWESFTHTFSYFFSLKGVLSYALVLSIVKVIHELAHAYSAKHFGVPVPTMGVAFLLLWPVLYTDVTHSWRLSRRKARLTISGAGIFVESIIAGLSTLGWALSSPGLAQSVFFILCTATWARSLFINFNPIMRFDGYYLLCDFWGIDNLRGRSFALARWKWHEFFFRMGDPCPEDFLPERTIRGMCIYAFASWIYLFFLYTAIASFVYFSFTKALGIILFALEIVVFFIWPVIYEAQILIAKKKQLSWTRRSIVALLLFSAGFLWFTLPLSHSYTLPAIVTPFKQQTLYLPEAAILEALYIRKGQSVEPGQALVRLKQPTLTALIKQKQLNLALAQQHLDRLTIHRQEKSLIAPVEAQIAVAEEELSHLLEKQDQLTLYAEIPGTIDALDEDLRLQEPLPKHHIIGKIHSFKPGLVRAFIPERQLKLFQEGQAVTVTVPHTNTKRSGWIKHISKVASSRLDYPSLSSALGGPIATTPIDSGDLQFIDSYYSALIQWAADEEELPYGKIVSIEVKGKKESFFMYYLYYIYSILIRESSF